MNQPASTPRLRFGELAIRAGWLGQQHIDWALRVQADRKQAGVHLYLGSILVQQRYITVEQAVQILKHQRVQLMVDPTTGHRYNVHNFTAGQAYKSPESPATLQVLQQVDSLVVRGDIGLRQVQQGAGAAHHPPPGQGGQASSQSGTNRWATDSSAAGNWDEEWGGGHDSAVAAPVATPVQGTADGPVYAELTSDEKKSGNDDYDWYGQTILDDGSLAQQLRQAAAANQAAAAVAAPTASAPARSNVKAKPGTVVFLAMAFTDESQKVYRTITDLCVAKGIGTVRMDDVADTTAIWKGIERFIAGSHFMIADFSGTPQPPTHVVHEAQHATRSRKPTVVVTSNPASKQQCASIGVTLVGDYPAGDMAKLQTVLDGLIDQALRQANLVA